MNQSARVASAHCEHETIIGTSADSNFSRPDHVYRIVDVSAMII